MGFRRRSVKQKLTLISMCATAVALLLACALFLAYDYATFRDQELRALDTLATTIGAGSTAALSFDDPETAHEALASLASHPGIVFARVHTPDGRLFAAYAPEGASDVPEMAAPASGEYVTWDYLETVQPIMLADERIGDIVVRASRDAQHSRIRRFAGVAVAIIVTAWIAAFALTSRLQRLISEPLLSLARAAARVSQERDYSIRVVPKSNDEVGDLVARFNQMLEQIQHQDEQLRRHRATLEKQVALRTAELTKANRDLALSRDRAEEANRAKSQFLANVSHEIRTPMNGVIGMIDLTLDSTLTPDQREQLLIVKSSAESLVHIVNDILDLSKIEAGRLDLDATSFVVREVVQDAVRTASVGARGKGLAVECDIDESVASGVTADAGRLRQVIINLVGNAVKFTERGSVRIKVWIERDAEGQPFLYGSVSDTGIGIAADKQGLIFEAFAQADGSTTRRFGGTGLGLTISARLLSLMGGRLWVDSVEGEGSTFHFNMRVVLPQDQAAAAGEPIGGVAAAAGAAQAAPAGARRALRVLLVEDNIVNQRVARGVLVKAGHQVWIASNGREALDALAGNTFDLVLMDMQMPIMGGLDAITAIRAEERRRGGRLPIIAVTAHALEGDREQFIAAGADGYVSKPITMARLVSEIEAVLQTASPATAVAPRA